MSFKALNWAFEQEITQTAPQGHVFLAIANYANEHDFSYPSIKTIAKKTRLNEKTVRKSLQELCDLGLLIETENVSQFGSKVYKICYQHECKFEQVLNDTPTKFGSATKITTPTKNGSTPLPNLPLPPTKNGSTPLPNLVDNPVSKPIREPVSNTVSNTRTSKTKKFITIDELKNLGVDEQIAIDFLATRKTKLTQTALDGIIRESRNANISLNQAIQFSVEQGWQSFKCDWYTNRLTQQKNGANHETRQSNSVADYRDTLQQQYDEYWANQAEQGANRPSIIDVY